VKTCTSTVVWLGARMGSASGPASAGAGAAADARRTGTSRSGTKGRFIGAGLRPPHRGRAACQPGSASAELIQLVGSPRGDLTAPFRFASAAPHTLRVCVGLPGPKSARPLAPLLSRQLNESDSAAATSLGLPRGPRRAPASADPHAGTHAVPAGDNHSAIQAIFCGSEAITMRSLLIRMPIIPSFEGAQTQRGSKKA
jgi:hypothetical protein